MKIEVSTTQYEFVHGRKPRGAYTCGWTFYFEGERYRNTFNGTWSEARKQAIKYARSCGYKEVKVAT